MSATSPCVPCCSSTTETVNVPGTTGVNAYTTTVDPITIPAAGGPGSIEVGNTSWMAVGQILFISDLVDYAHFQVVTIPDITHVNLDYVGYTGDAVNPAVIGAGAKVSPSGTENAFTTAALQALNTTLLAAITDFTDSTGVQVGQISDTLAAGVGKFTHSVYFRAMAITGNILIYTYTPGFNFKIHRISASIVDALAAGGDAATLTTAIAGTPITGGVVVLSGTYAIGLQQTSSTVISAANSGTDAQAITVTASAVTVYDSGGFMLHFEMQNMDTAIAIASIADKINDTLAALKT